MAIGNPLTLTSQVASKTISIIATASQTAFTVTGGYRINQLAVFRNGVRLVDSRDYEARDGATVTLLSAASDGDAMEFQVFDAFQVADTINPYSTYQTINGNLNITGIITAATFSITDLDVRNITAVAATFTGQVTYEDVTNVDSIGIITARQGIDIQGGIGATFADNVKAFFGNDGELQIWSNGTNPAIDAISGDLLIRNLGTTGDIYIDAKSGERGIKIIQDGEVELYYDGTKTFKTAGAGATVQSSSTTIFGVQAGTNSSNSNIELGDPDSKSVGMINYRHADDSLRFYTNDAERVKIDRAGNVNITGIATATQLYEGTTRVATSGKAIAMALIFG